MIDRKYWPLLVTHAAKSFSLAPVQLQKSLFLIGRNLDQSKLTADGFYHFEPYDYGPFSALAYLDADELEFEGLLEIRRPPEAQYRLYTATVKGADEAVALRAKLPSRALAYVDSVVAWTCSLSFNQLVSKIYELYPEMKVNSVFSK